MKPGFWEKSEIFLRRLEMQMFSVTPQILFYVILFLIFNYIQPNSIWTFFEFAHLKKKKKHTHNLCWVVSEYDLPHCLWLGLLKCF